MILVESLRFNPRKQTVHQLLYSLSNVAPLLITPYGSMAHQQFLRFGFHCWLLLIVVDVTSLFNQTFLIHRHLLHSNPLSHWFLLQWLSQWKMFYLLFPMIPQRRFPPITYRITHLHQGLSLLSDRQTAPLSLIAHY